MVRENAHIEIVSKIFFTLKTIHRILDTFKIVLTDVFFEPYMTTIRYKERFNKNHFEQAAWAANKLICGIDEVGRGCLAGPVVVAAVMLHPGKNHRLLKDSKIMTKEEREKAYSWIINNSWHVTASMHHRIVDSHNIYHATLKAMKRAFMQLMSQGCSQPSKILIDAMPLQLNNSAFAAIEVLCFPFGEKKSSSIAAASIVAKVTRDRLMEHFDTAVPGYLLGAHKGYATPTHRALIKDLGHSFIHRINFLQRVFELAKKDDWQEQCTLL